MQRDREYDNTSSKWNDWFNRDPRLNQRRLFQLCNNHVNGTRPTVLQAPTGSGKTFIGEFVGILATSPDRQFSFICHTTNLQTQMYNDTLDRFARTGKIVTTLFGRSRYFCIHLMEAVDLSLIMTTDTIRAAIRRVLNDYGRLAKEMLLYPEVAPDKTFWAMPLSTQVIRKLMDEGVPENIADQVWDQVSCDNCNIDRTKVGEFETHGCLQRLHRLRTINVAHLAIINSSIVMTYAAQGILSRLFPRTCVCIFDEAHTIPAVADQLCQHLVPKPLAFVQLQHYMTEFATNDLTGKIVNGTVDLDQFNILRPDDTPDEGKLVFDETRCEVLCLRPTIEDSIWAKSSQHISKMNTLRHGLARIFLKNSKQEDVDSLSASEQEDVDSLSASEQEEVNSLSVSEQEEVDSLSTSEQEEVDSLSASEQENISEIDKAKLQHTKGKFYQRKFRTYMKKYSMTPETQIMCKYICDTIRRCFARPDRISNDAIYSMCLKTMASQLNYVFKTHLCADAIAMASTICRYSENHNTGVLKRKINEILGFIDAINLLNLAKNKNEWLTSKHMDIAPIATETGITYKATEIMRSKLLRTHLWEPLANCVRVSPFLMSATIADLSQPNNTQFSQFKRDTGIKNTVTAISNTVFDSARITLYHPYLPMWKHEMSNGQLEQNFADRVNEIITLIRGNPRGTLIVGTHSELDKLMPFLQNRLPLLRILLYKNAEQEVERLKHAPHVAWEDIVILGSDKMYTGLNLPTCLGLVVILKALNMAPNQAVNNYNKLLDPHNYAETNKKRCDHRRLMRQVQAVGRLMRCETDGGVVAFLSHHPNDLKSIQVYYPDAQYVRNRPELYRANTYNVGMTQT